MAKLHERITKGLGGGSSNKNSISKEEKRTQTEEKKRAMTKASRDKATAGPKRRPPTRKN